MTQGKVAGIAGDVAGGLKSAGEAATKDVIKGIGQAPMDILKDLIGGGTSESGTSGGAGGTSGASTGDASSDSVSEESSQAQLQKKIEEAQKKREAALAQARQNISSYENQWEKTKQEQAKKKQEEELEENQESVAVKQLEQNKKQEALVLAQAKQAKGSGETGRKKH